MSSGISLVISNIYKGGRLAAVPAFASVISLAVSFVSYRDAAADASHTAPVWLSAWVVSLPLVVLPSAVMFFARDKGRFTTIAFTCAVAAMAATALLVYGHLIPEGGSAFAGQLICTVPYLTSCAAAVTVSRVASLHREEENRDTPGSYSSRKMDFLSERGKIELSIMSDRLLYMESESNYLTVAYLDKGPKGRDRVTFKKIRSSLKSVEARFRGFPLAKANRSCIVNGERIDHVVVKGRGGMLKLHGYDAMLKISQQNLSAFLKHAEQ